MVLACAFLCGCSNSIVISDYLREYPAGYNESDSLHSNMIELKRINLTNEKLLLDFKIQNYFEHDIWVCSGVHTCYKVVTAIHNNCLVIYLHIKSPIKKVDISYGCQLREYIGTYNHVPKGSSRTDSIYLEVPVENTSLLRWPKILDGIILNVGFFDEEAVQNYYNTLFENDGISMNISDAKLNGLWLFDKDEIVNQQIAELKISNITIPCL